MKLLNKFNFERVTGQNLFLDFPLILKLPFPLFFFLKKYILMFLRQLNMNLKKKFLSNLSLSFNLPLALFRLFCEWVSFIYSRTSSSLFAFLYLPAFISCSEPSARLFSLLLFSLCWYSGVLTLLPESKRDVKLLSHVDLLWAAQHFSFMFLFVTNYHGL